MKIETRVRERDTKLLVQSTSFQLWCLSLNSFPISSIMNFMTDCFNSVYTETTCVLTKVSDIQFAPENSIYGDTVALLSDWIL